MAGNGSNDDDDDGADTKSGLDDNDFLHLCIQSDYI